MFVTAIIAAAGRSARLSGGTPKQLLPVAGRSLLERSVAAFVAHGSVDEIVVALPADLAPTPPPYLRSPAKPVRVVSGGERRQDSVGNAFAAADPRAEIILIHDAARPFVSAALIDRTIAAAHETGAAVAALSARDTVKEGAPAVEGARGWIVKTTLSRESIFLVQTPQAFRRAVLRDALALKDDATDEASLAERAGHVVRLVEGDVANIKITTADDLAIAEAIAVERDAGSGELRLSTSAAPARTGRAGIGYDLHRLVAGRPLILGGVTIPFDRGLAGHSDADAVCHAITDAVLGAAGAGDIGAHFPDTDPAWKDASSIDLLRRAAAIAGERGLEVGNVDASVIAERPKLAPFVDAMCANVAR